MAVLSGPALPHLSTQGSQNHHQYQHLSPHPPLLVLLTAEVITLRLAVASLESCCTALTARFDASYARTDILVSQQAKNEGTLVDFGLVESHQVAIASVTALTEKLDVVAFCLERLGNLACNQCHRCLYPGGKDLLHPVSSVSC